MGVRKFFIKASRKPKLFWPIVVVVFLLLVVDITQLVWPRDRLLPGQKIDGVAVGLMKNDAAASKLRKLYEAQQIEIIGQNNQQIAKLSPKQLGLTIDTRKQIEKAIDYPLWQRFVPFSFVYRIWKSDVSYPRLTVKDQTSLVADIAHDAEIVISGDVLTVKPSAIGYEFKVDALKKSLSGIKFSTKSQPVIKLDIKIVQPDIATAAAEALRGRIMSAISDGLVLTFEGQKFNLARAEVLGWLTFAKNPDTNQLDVTVARERVEKSLTDHKITEKVNVAATQTSINTLNGRETSRQNGTDGRTINYDNLLAAVQDHVLNSGGAISITTAKIAPPVKYNRSYTNDMVGLNAELADHFAGKAYAIQVISLASGQTLVSVNPDRVFTAASTYKLFVAYSMLKAVEDGSATWDSPLNGTTLATCFDRMIVNSDNACPEAWLKEKTYKAVTAEARSIGAGSTCLGCANGMTTTARDLANFLLKIYHGSILSSGSNAQLIDAMKRNVYRQGIPAGIGPNGTVADKVGFLSGLLHDAAIVYSKKGNYIMVIMTSGSSWSSIADTTRAIYQRL